MNTEKEMKKRIGRDLAGNYYDLQSLRIASKNRLRDLVRKKIEGIPFDKVEEKKDSDKKKKEKKYTDEQLFDKWNELLDKGEITQSEFDSAKVYWNLIDEIGKLENKYERKLMPYVEEEEIYQRFLKHIKGIGIVLSANLIKEFGYCETYDNVAKLWAHTGNNVNEQGLAPRRRTGQKTTFNPQLRTLTWRIGDCLIKSNQGIYKSIYNSEKQKLLNRRYEPGELKEKYGTTYKEDETALKRNHAHMMALRKMRKIFLSHYWACAREIKGLPTRELYVVEKLNHSGIITWREAIAKEDVVTDTIKAK